jgi:ethanolamine utilization protein EutQ (cupin superfamily)
MKERPTNGIKMSVAARYKPRSGAQGLRSTELTEMDVVGMRVVNVVVTGIPISVDDGKTVVMVVTTVVTKVVGKRMVVAMGEWEEVVMMVAMEVKTVEVMLTIVR